MMRYRLAAILLGCLLDMIFGDPRRLLHPVCVIGSLITRLEAFFRKCFPNGEKGERMAGIFMTVSVLFITGGFAAAFLALFYQIHPYAGVLAEALFCFQMMAFKSLRTESMKVYDALAAGDTKAARKAVSMIVGRDTQALTQEGITKAAIETVAENTSDGIIAPLIYMVVGGGVGIYLYKAVNTMDSMVGYKNDRYLNFGRAAARLDDVCNYIPARISALLMIGAGYLCELFHRGMGGKSGIYSGSGGWRIFKRDRYHHKSPNSAQTESVCAGVLGVELAGDAWYFGTLYRKPVIGEPLRAVEYEDIRRANDLTAWTYVLALLIMAAAMAALAMGIPGGS